MPVAYMWRMENISLFLPEATIDMLVHVARKRGVSFGDVVRDGVMREFISSLGDDGPKHATFTPPPRDAEHRA